MPLHPFGASGQEAQDEAQNWIDAIDAAGPVSTADAKAALLEAMTDPNCPDSVRQEMAAIAADPQKLAQFAATLDRGP